MIIHRCELLLLLAALGGGRGGGVHQPAGHLGAGDHALEETAADLEKKGY